MWRLIKFIFTGSFHEHEWIIEREGKVWDPARKGPDCHPVQLFYILQCKKCGCIKKKIIVD